MIRHHVLLMPVLRRFCVVVLLILSIPAGLARAGETLVLGYVRSKSDKSPIAAANIYIEGTRVGTQTDDEGFFLLRHTGPENKLIISSIGYKTQHLTLRPGEPVSVNIELREDIRALQELFVFPGVNPATLLMKKIREAAVVNDIHNSGRPLRSDEQDLILMPVGNESSRIRYQKWTRGIYSSTDSAVFLPLYVANESYLHQGRNKRQQLRFSSGSNPPNLMVLLEKLAGNLKPEINFYNNNLVLFEKNLVSPLSTTGNAFYQYFLMDSIQTVTGKNYHIRFKSRNPKNLAFNGDMYIDSASLALTSIEVQLPGAANLNYINKLAMRQVFEKQGKSWIPARTELNVTMDYAVQIDSTRLIPELYLFRSIQTTLEDSTIRLSEGFAGTEFEKEELEYKLAELNNIPLMKAARWIADVVITGYAQVGKTDIGKVYQFARLTEQEGLRMNLPLRTNEQLSPVFSVGGYWGYGMVSKSHYFSVNSGFKLPFYRKTVVRAGYTDDLRRVDYEYNDYMVKENPLNSGDVDIANTLIGLNSTDRLNRRREWSASLTHDWSDDVESQLYARSTTYYAADRLELIRQSGPADHYQQNSLTLVTRFSTRERTYEDHLDRIYVQNELPVLYVITETGVTDPLEKSQWYGKLMLKLKQKVLFQQGQWMYSVDAGWLLGEVPYNLLFVHGSGKAFTHRKLHFNLMGFMEYATDHYISTHQELMFNGIVFNSIPGIRHLNLRELFTLKAIYGGLSSHRNQPYKMPAGMSALNQPYIELGAGITNIFKIGSVQSVWRLTDRHKPGISARGIVIGIRFSF